MRSLKIMLVLLLTTAQAEAQAVVSGFKIQRGYFSFPDHENSVRIGSDADFQVCLWARNVEVKPGGIQVITPKSQFRGPGSSGDEDALSMDVPKQTGMNLGCIGGVGSERFIFSAAGNSRVTVFFTVITAPGATVSMDRN